MNLILALLLLVFVLRSNAENCKEKNEFQSLCFSTIKPILDRSKSLQREVDNLKHEAENLSEFKKSMEHLEAKTNTILQNMASQNEKVEEKLQNLQKLIEVKNAEVGLPYQKIGSKYYYIEKNEKVNWFQAANRCTAIGGHLISFKNQHEIDAIKKILPPSTDYWIDINDLANEGEYVSVATGSRASYLIWRSGQPDNYNKIEHCGEINSNIYQMNDFSCSKEQLFICEFRNQH
ncbi:C-type lectin 37Db-like [Drosophila sulfurigaster albostrigata]|uniref:C-type lectin 37Db-like n=1 Tax=Drosophila sulfurigaster albostrigata TaxID=89887 RepID=UPI002D21E68F|nr:C-type lectin 37Db-like [Drosophila sulfurigaster albostrigata]